MDKHQVGSVSQSMNRRAGNDMQHELNCDLDPSKFEWTRPRRRNSCIIKPEGAARNEKNSRIRTNKCQLATTDNS